MEELMLLVLKGVCPMSLPAVVPNALRHYFPNDEERAFGLSGKLWESAAVA